MDLISPTKNFLKSKTLWFNLLTIGATFAVDLPPKWSTTVIALINIGLRIVSTQGLTFFSE